MRKGWSALSLASHVVPDVCKAKAACTVLEARGRSDNNSAWDAMQANICPTDKTSVYFVMPVKFLLMAQSVARPVPWDIGPRMVVPVYSVRKETLIATLVNQDRR